MFEMSSLMQAAPAAGGSMTSTLVLVGAMFLVFWLLVWRPQAKEQEAHQKLVNSLKVGDEVVTNSGILGKITKVDEKVLTLMVSKKTTIRVMRDQVRGLQSTLLSDEPAGDGPQVLEAEESDADDGKKKGASW